ASLGAKVLIVEKGIRPGGASVITGTIPSKSLRETVKYVELLSRSNLSGIDIQLERKITVQELMHRKNSVVTQRVEDIIENYRQKGVDYMFGRAEFVSPHELKVECSENDAVETIKAEKFIIAVGTNPFHPSDIEFDGKSVLDSDTILMLERIPESLAIIGGGVIGCEYASIFTRLGTCVYLIDPRGTLLDFIDREISLALTKVMESDGVVLRLGEQYQEVKVVDDRVRIRTDSGEAITTEALLFANGRQGTADRLNLSVCGLEINKRNQLEVNDNYQTSVPHIYAVGDVIGFPSLVSVSNEEGRRAARHAVAGVPGSRVGNDIPYGIYTLPEISMVGPTEDQLIKQEIPYQVGICRFQDLARGMIVGERKGMLKLLIHKETHEVLGVHIFGQTAAELIHIGQAVINLKGNVAYFLETVMN
ncbi:MAG: Si-specific NAD(P)(+) transhydrogenase, partial [Proteobacteria bacterium]|nr:Si-specific NAD(P)(+) transhydrogenase [Pseudomonadota bacterium]